MNKVSIFSIGSEPFLSKDPFPDAKRIPMLHIELNLSELVDIYAYHDFPSDQDLWLTDKEVEELILILNDRLDKMKVLREKATLDK